MIGGPSCRRVAVLSNQLQQRSLSVSICCSVHTAQLGWQKSHAMQLQLPGASAGFWAAELVCRSYMSHTLRVQPGFWAHDSLASRMCG